MNRKNYASDNQKSIIEIDLCNDSSDESNSDNWTYNRERHHVRSSQQFFAQSSNRTTARFEERPLTPPPPVISFPADVSQVKNRPPKVERPRQILLMDNPPPPPIFSFEPDSLADRFRENDTQNVENDNFFSERGQPKSIICPPSTSPPSFSFNRNTLENVKSSWKSKQKANALDSSNTMESNLTLTIVDEGPNRRRLGQKNWLEVESALCKVYLDIMHENPGPPPVCRVVGMFLGCAKVIGCADERSQRLYKLAISRLGAVWPGAKLRIVNRNEISTSALRLRCTTFLPAEPSSSQAILDCIQKFNPNLRTNKWSIINVGAPSRINKERHVVMSVDIESLPVIERRGGIFSFGSRPIKVTVNKRDIRRMQLIQENDRNFVSKVSTSRKQRWSEVEADEENEVDDDDSETDSEDEDYE
ncbi:PREDICTED: uncharacterized protein LOC108359438 [Rhagoletis zephyria]|uniref:uncharacterized protein LOC108359438 n=1 Tax=Rhagoletis zephyria TaxID=28612 RepID=UPI0008113487|nr:PREDICTED: uncharacterized protein LOC108359438 [Rhagoletis zephyria]